MDIGRGTFGFEAVLRRRVSQKMAPVVRQLYDQMPEPRSVIAMGVCASSGGMFNNFAIVQGVDNVIPVDIYVPGCPPTPDAVIYAIEKLRDRIRTNDPKGGLKVNA
jgi:NADH-quinone oxidoreductase subunit B